MKKIFTLVAMACMAIGVNAQVLVAERDWTGVSEYDLGFWQESDNTGATYEMVADGIAINNPQDMGEGKEWMPQMSVLQGFDLAEDVTYKVVITAKFPSDGNLQVNMGDWTTNKQYVVPVSAGDDFQKIDIEFPDFPADATNAHVLFQPGRIAGTIILKKVQVYDMSSEPTSDEEVIFERDWTGVAEYDYGFWQESDNTGATYQMVADGIAINNPQDMGEGKEWMPQMSVLQGFDLAEDETYIVRITAKFPSSGGLQVNMGDWTTNKQYIVPVEAGDDFQVVDVEFPDFPADATNAHVLFQPGRIVGTIILKKVQVIHKGGSTGIETVKASKAFDGAIFNLAGQKVNANYKGVVIQNGKKFIQK